MQVVGQKVEFTSLDLKQKDILNVPRGTLKTITMKTVFNGTPHAINIIEGAINIIEGAIEGAINIIEGAIFNPTLRKYVGGSIVLSIPSNGMLNAKINTLEGQSVNGIPTFEKCFSGVGSVFLKNFPMGVLGF